MTADDRGQLLLVAGILLAVTFVALALLVNTAIYTDNVATRGGDTAGETLQYQAGVTDAIGGILAAENANESHEGREDIRDAVRTGTGTVENISDQNSLRRGVSTQIKTEYITSDNTTDGLLIRETDVSEFDSWTANASAASGFVIDLDASAMDEEDPPFVIALNDTDVEVNKTGGEIVVEVEEEDIECRTDATGTVRFDVTGERLDGELCLFGWPTLDEDSEIGVEDGRYASGSYRLTIESDDSPAEISPEPVATEVIYSVDIDLRIDTPELRYETTVRVTPGEENG